MATYPNHSQDISELCRYADAAMYLAKTRGDAYLVFEDWMLFESETSQRSSLRHASTPQVY